ncbi:MAG: hypothetical protein PWQ68_1549 [Thermoanaerobacteraceae bacterium]|nr:hypothetical protein [Thermoanaerobacteraceae bacterium]
MKFEIRGETLPVVILTMEEGESVFTESGGMAWMTDGFEMKTKIIPIQLNTGQSIICQKKAFLCAERTVKLEIFLKKKLGAGLFGGEGFILERVTGPGLCFVEMDGEVVEYNLDPAARMKVDTGHVAMFEPTVDFDIEMIKGFTVVSE